MERGRAVRAGDAVIPGPPRVRLDVFEPLPRPAATVPPSERPATSAQDIAGTRPLPRRHRRCGCARRRGSAEQRPNSFAGSAVRRKGGIRHLTTVPLSNLPKPQLDMRNLNALAESGIGLYAMADSALARRTDGDVRRSWRRRSCRRHAAHRARPGSPPPRCRHGARTERWRRLATGGTRLRLAATAPAVSAQALDVPVNSGSSRRQRRTDWVRRDRA